MPWVCSILSSLKAGTVTVWLFEYMQHLVWGLECSCFFKKVFYWKEEVSRDKDGVLHMPWNNLDFILEEPVIWRRGKTWIQFIFKKLPQAIYARCYWPLSYVGKKGTLSILLITGIPSIQHSAWNIQRTHEITAEWMNKWMDEWKVHEVSPWIFHRNREISRLYGEFWSPLC